MKVLSKHSLKGVDSILYLNTHNNMMVGMQIDWFKTIQCPCSNPGLVVPLNMNVTGVGPCSDTQDPVASVVISVRGNSADRTSHWQSQC